eukprot:1156686-Pelagomonas_calceolata.AAC.7
MLSIRRSASSRIKNLACTQDEKMDTPGLDEEEKSWDRLIAKLMCNVLEVRHGKDHLAVKNYAHGKPDTKQSRRCTYKGEINGNTIAQIHKLIPQILGSSDFLVAANMVHSAQKAILPRN